jgi:hypothetical protein
MTLGLCFLASVRAPGAAGWAECLRRVFDNGREGESPLEIPCSIHLSYGRGEPFYRSFRASCSPLPGFCLTILHRSRKFLVVGNTSPVKP